MSAHLSSGWHTTVARVLVILPFTYVAAQDGNITQDISTIQDYSLQQQCVQTCFQMSNDFCPMDLLGIALGCASMGCATKGWQAKNDCYCRLDLQQPAQDYLDGCISKSCTVGDPSVAAGSAGSIYRRYCEEKGYDTTAPVSAEASTIDSTKPALSTRSRAAPTATNPPEEGTLGGSSSPQGGLSTAALVGIILGAIVVVVALIGLVWWYRGRRPPPPPPPPSYPYYPLSVGSVNRLHELKDLRAGDSVSNFGSQAPPPMLSPPRPLAPPGSVQSGSTGMVQPYLLLR